MNVPNDPTIAQPMPRFRAWLVLVPNALVLATVPIVWSIPLMSRRVDGVSAAHVTAWLIVLLGLCLSVLCIAVGVGLQRRRAWARLAGIIIGVLSVPAWFGAVLPASIVVGSILDGMRASSAVSAFTLYVTGGTVAVLGVLPNWQLIRYLVCRDVSA